MAEDRLAAARAVLAAAGCQGLVVYNADPHLSEYLPARWGGREWLSRFPGSAGTVAITAHHAALFVDSRYLLLAEAAMAGTPFEVHLAGPADPAPHLAWLVRHVPAGGAVLTDAMVLALGEQRVLAARLAEAGIALRTDIDVFGTIWADRPAVPAEPAWLHEPAEALVPARDKFARLREAMASAGATHHFVSALDDIAWLTNLRGRDIAHNPLFVAHLLVGPEDSTLFALPRGFDRPAQAVLAGAGVQLAAYDAALPALAALPEGAALLLDPRRVTHGFRAAVPEACRVIEALNPAALFKRIKTAGEIDGFRETMIEDGLALCRFQAAFEASRARGDAWTEWQVHEALTAERARSPLFRGLSFHTSAGFNAN
ncbi:MAG: aminopeptidase P family N-terminal domain-containing protein, partial [Novosphingobium sp.]|nr:aminopeptidase P family N-terminal domain-containing protein [Novosphingobium sp.]